MNDGAIYVPSCLFAVWLGEINSMGQAAVPCQSVLPGIVRELRQPIPQNKPKTSQIFFPKVAVNKQIWHPLV